MQVSKSLRGFILLEAAFVYFIILIIVICSGDIVDLGRTVPERMMLLTGVYVGMAGAAILVFYSGKWGKNTLGFSRKHIGKQVLIGLGLFALTFCTGVLLPLLLGEKSMALNWKAPTVPILLFYIVFDIVCVGFGEELIFRGYFFERLRIVFGSSWLVVGISALLFGLYHYPGSLHMSNVISTGVLGAVYALFRWKIKDCTLLSLGLAHGLHDGLIMVLSYYML
ncbi:MAG: CPBP family intramembrane metalloprotease [Lachnospiraceae bacterium]|jgi:membrane protease YdiL (CAAX protease family)|nr:CPBP family intramembrane metalloprotease [Lachnospiraceae bacterium]